METLSTILALAFGAVWILGAVALAVAVLAVPFLIALLDSRGSGRRARRAT